MNKLNSIIQCAANKKILLMLSGGKDSITSLILLKEANLDVTAIHYHVLTTKSLNISLKVQPKAYLVVAVWWLQITTPATGAGAGEIIWAIANWHCLMLAAIATSWDGGLDEIDGDGLVLSRGCICAPMQDWEA